MRRLYLIERMDFAKGTSSRSTKLVHGGVRYLAQGDVALVREALRERGRLGKNAPHLFKSEAFIIPGEKWWTAPYYTFGLYIEMLAFMPCNLSIGGFAKGIVVREVDALGGEMAKNIDKSYIQMKMLNTGKGPAIRTLRAQADKEVYSKEMRKTVENQENLTLRQTMINEILVEDGKVIG